MAAVAVEVNSSTSYSDGSKGDGGEEEVMAVEACVSNLMLFGVTGNLPLREEVLGPSGEEVAIRFGLPFRCRCAIGLVVLAAEEVEEQPTPQSPFTEVPSASVDKRAIISSHF